MVERCAAGSRPVSTSPSTSPPPVDFITQRQHQLTSISPYTYSTTSLESLDTTNNLEGSSYLRLCKVFSSFFSAERDSRDRQLPSTDKAIVASGTLTRSKRWLSLRNQGACISRSFTPAVWTLAAAIVDIEDAGVEAMLTWPVARSLDVVLMQRHLVRTP
jgi:hypothetical protein